MQTRNIKTICGDRDKGFTFSWVVYSQNNIFEWLIKYFSAFKQFVNSLDCLVGVSWPIHSARALRASPAYALVNAQAFM